MDQKTLELIFQEGDLPSLNPHKNITHIRGVTLNKLLFESLTRIDENKKVIFAGADSVDISDDKMKYIFTLRDCKYSDGTKITAYDYESAWKKAILPNSGCLRCDLFYVIKNAQAIKEGKIDIDELGVKALDEKTLEVRLEYFYEKLLELFSCSIFSPIKELNLDLNIFNGPFVVEHWNKNQNIKLVKNQNYWDKKNIYLNNIEINFVKDVQKGLSLFQEQKIDWLGSPISVLSLKNFTKNDCLTVRSSNFIFWLYINTNLKHFQSKDIRKALSLAIDRKFLNKDILMGEEPISFLPNKITSSSKRTFEYDPSKAIKYFKKGLDNLGISQSQFPEIKLSYFDRPEMKSLGLYLKQVWEKTLNVKVNLIEQDWNYFRESQEKDNFEIAGCYESSLYPGPLDLLQLIENRFTWDNSEYKKNLLALKTANNPKQKEIYLNKAMDNLMEEMPLITLSNEKEVFAVSSRLKGYCFDSANSVDFSRAYFDK